MGCYKSGHGRAVSVLVCLAGSARVDEVRSFENGAIEVRVPADARIDDGDRYSLASADLLRFGDSQILQVPLAVTEFVGERGGAEERYAGNGQYRHCRGGEPTSHLL
jgi:hypothetical protein